MVVDVIRKNSLAALPISGGAGAATRPPAREHSPHRAGSGGAAPPPSASGGAGGSPQRRASPARRTESPGRVVGGRPPSPGRRLGEKTHGRADSAGLTRLERMRLNLDDPAAAPAPGPMPASASHGSTGSLGGGASTYNGSGYSLTDAPVSSLPTAAPMATPRPLHTPAPSTSGALPAPGGGKKPQTFAEMGIHGAKAEEKECVIM